MPVESPSKPPLTREQIIDAIRVKQEIERRKTHRMILTLYPDAGPLRRELYVPHQKFFAAGAQYRERLMCAANRIGKSLGVGGYETALHLTGWYPDWWIGRRFDHCIRAWACGDTSKNIREIVQDKLFGPPGAWGTGLIPGECLHRVVRSHAVPDLIDSAFIKHKSGKLSHLVLKSYEQGRQAFQGTEQDLIWLDEEPPLDVYTECLLRTMTSNGVVIMTFTPLMGVSEVVLAFLPGGKLEEPGSDATKFVVMASWEDAPHLSEQAKKELWASIPPYQRDARSKGIPQLGSGAIYPVPESDLLVDPFEIPAHWPRGYGMDVGWNVTAAIWGAYDRPNDCLYLTHEYRRAMAEPSIHAHAIKVPGAWMPGFIDPASRGRSQKDGSQLLEDYIQLGLRLSCADNGVESGLYSVWNRMSTGRLKVFRSLQKWLAEFRLYRRDDKGRVVKENDHLCDGLRYLESRVQAMITKPVPQPGRREVAAATSWS